MSTLRVGVLGWGAIGSAVGERLVAGALSGVQLSAIATRTVPAGAPVPIVEPTELPNRCDAVVEATGHDGVRAYVPGLLGAGCHVVLVSAGALRDRDLFTAVRSIGGHLLTITGGAVGGLDIIRACRHAGAIKSIRLITTKPSHTLAQPWMTGDMAARLAAGEGRVECFRGSADDAAERFPMSVNVAATLAISAESWELIEVQVIGDPTATINRHQIEIEADVGRYRIELMNYPLSTNPRSSALVVASVLRDLDDLRQRFRHSPGMTLPDS